MLKIETDNGMHQVLNILTIVLSSFVIFMVGLVTNWKAHNLSANIPSMFSFSLRHMESRKAWTD